MSDENFFHEVSEELRSDRMREAWRRYGLYVVGAAILLVVVVGVYEGWSWWQRSNSARSSDAFYAALDLESSGNIKGAEAAMATLTKDGSGNYPVLARFKEASLLARQGDTKQALAAYDGLATAQSDPRLRNTALLLAAELLVDKGDVGAVKSRVQGLIGPDSPFSDVALEAIGLTQYKAKDLKGAMATFGKVLDDPQANRDVKGRVELYVAQLVAEGAQLPAPPAGTNPTPAVKAPAASAATPPAKGADATTKPPATPAPSTAPATPPSASSTPPVAAPAAQSGSTSSAPANAPAGPATTPAPSGAASGK